MDEPYYVTAERLEELKQELETLRTDKRIEVAKRLKRAKELGDLSENSEYIEAREEQAQVERRIFELEKMVKNASLITKEGLGNDWVKIGSTILVSKNGVQQRFTIVGSSEANPLKGFISNESPLGKAFLDKRVGDTMKVKVPSGEVTYRIDKIE
ncbi:MAG: transcription elongation factor GreA [Patescibacteria group bacterium]